MPDLLTTVQSYYWTGTKHLLPVIVVKIGV